MEDMVTARVPREIRRQGNMVLQRIGATPTQLVNNAYEYVIRHGKLPRASEREKERAQTITPEEREALRDFLVATQLSIPQEWASLSAKEIRAARLKEKHGHTP
jgi:antitoxin component of RelBE/YafQ-DinJ toxin-antitoxin module